jgi:hypothetical protein
MSYTEANQDFLERLEKDFLVSGVTKAAKLSAVSKFARTRH